MAPKPAPAVAKPEQPKAPEVPKLSKEEVLDRDRWERVVDMVRRGRLDALKAFVEKQSTTSEGEKKEWTGRLPLWMAEEHRGLPTLLHVAASSDQPDVVRWLLEEQRVDPTSTSASASSDGQNGQAEPPSAPAAQRTAYECAASRNVRNVFRRSYADHPDWCDWHTAAKVPSPLTEEMESTQAEKGKTAHKVNLKQKMRERAAEREREAEVEAEKQRAVAEEEEKRRAAAATGQASSGGTGPQRLGGAAPRAVIEQTQLKGLSEQAKMRIERERRAKAAEARMAAR